MSKSRFFIAILPPDAILYEVVAFQKEIETAYGSKHAQNAPPHITIIPPFEANLEEVEILIETLSKSNFYNNPIEIYLDGFQNFDHRTLFVDVAKNEALERFSKVVKQLFNQQKIIPQRVEKHFFVPHITIANKDLKKKDFKFALLEFKQRDYQRKFLLTEIVVLRFEDRKWKLYKQIEMLN